MSVWFTAWTVPTGMPAGKIDVSAPCFQPEVTSRSPGLTVSDFATWSKMIELPGSLWRRIPVAPVFASSTETKLVSSVISFTWALLANTRVTVPTRKPVGETTGVLALTPLERPTSTTTRWSSWPGACAMMLVTRWR